MIPYRIIKVETKITNVKITAAIAMLKIGNILLSLIIYIKHTIVFKVYKVETNITKAKSMARLIFSIFSISPLLVIKRLKIIYLLATNKII